MEFMQIALVVLAGVMLFLYLGRRRKRLQREDD